MQLYAPLAVPMREDGELDIRGFQTNLKFYEQEPLDGYLVNGSSGEAEMLTSEERRTLLEITRESTDRRVIAGLSGESTKVTRLAIDGVADLDLHAVLIRTPSYFGKQHDQVRYFQVLADHSPHPVLIYQIPQYTGIKLDVDALNDLAHHPNIVGIKDSLGDLGLLAELDKPEGFSYLLGAAGLLLPGLASGASGGILALANLFPSLCRQLIDLYGEGRLEEARQLQAHLIPVNRAIGGSQGFGLAGLKAALEMLGLKGGPPRSPLRPLRSSQRLQLEAVVQKRQSPFDER